jgi:RNA polymerase sigma-70 factor (ECF subfamily)
MTSLTRSNLRGDSDAEAAAREMHAQLQAFISRRVESSEVAEDLTQEVFLRLVQRDGGDELADPIAWLYRVARNTIIDHYRSRRSTLTLGGEATEGPKPDFDPFTDEPAKARKEIAACLRTLVDQLDEPYRSAVTTVDFDGQTHASVAALTGLSVPGVKSRVQRGRRQLRQLLSRCCTTHTAADGRLIDFDTGSGCNPTTGCRPAESRDIT